MERAFEMKRHAAESGDQGYGAVIVKDRCIVGEAPNLTDGHWMAPIFGQSEPEANDKNRAILKDAAARRAWDGK